MNRIEYEQLVATLRWHEAQHDRVAANELLRQLVDHRRRVAKNDRFMLRCKIEINKKGGVKMWTSVKDKLPKIIYEDKNCNAVLVWWVEERVGGFQYGISNTEYVNIHPETIIHWAPLPAPPE